MPCVEAEANYLKALACELGHSRLREREAGWALESAAAAEAGLAEVAKTVGLLTLALWPVARGEAFDARKLLAAG